MPVISLTARERRWLAILSWAVAAVLFIRLIQILPCCQPPSMEAVLRGHACGVGAACPRYADCAPR